MRDRLFIAAFTEVILGKVMLVGGFFVCGCSATLKVSINVQKVSCVAFLINKEM